MSHSHDDDQHHHEDHHHHDAPDMPGLPQESALLEQALRELLIEKGVFSADELRIAVEAMEARGEALGARLIARAWTDPSFRSQLLESPGEAIAAFGMTLGVNELCVVENTERLHNVVVCTLCSCYPRLILGVPPAWYKSRTYRARTVKDPRAVLVEFGLRLPDHVEVRVHDSTADLRYLVLPMRPEGTENWTEAELARLVERGMNSALELADWSGFEGRRAEAAARGKLRGIGLANAIEQAGAIFEETAELHFGSDGSLTFASGTICNGQGHATAFRQLVGELLGIQADRVRFVQGDTDRISHGYGTFGSRSLAVGGAALSLASKKIIAKARLIAAHLMEVAESDLVFAQGDFRVAGTDRTISLPEVAQASFDRRMLPPGIEPGLSERAAFLPAAPTFPNGTHVCEVEIDPETGVVAVERYSVVHDVGRTLNHQLVEGQMHGAVMQGLGQALMEDVVYDRESGQLLSGSFQDYAMPRADALPEFRLGENDIPSTTNPLGMKGAGEGGTIGALPAVANAVMDALRPLGVRHLDMPFTPDRVWRAIREGAACR